MNIILALPPIRYATLSETEAPFTDENCFTETVQNQCSVKKAFVHVDISNSNVEIERQVND